MAALPSAAAVLRRIVPPALPPAQREKLIAFEARQLLSAAPAEAVWAAADFPVEAGAPGPVLVAAARREVVDAALAGHLAAGRTVRRLEPRSMALYRAFRYNHPDATTDGCALVDLGGGGLTVMLADGRAFAQRTARVAPAESGGTAPSWPLADGAAGRAMAERIHLELARLLAARDGGPAEAGRTLVQRMFFLGDDATHAALQSPVEARLGLVLERFDPLRRVTVATGIAGAPREVDLAEWVGLALPPTPDAPMLDLAPASWRSACAAREHRGAVRAALVATCLLPLPPGGLAWSEARAEARAADRLRAEVATLAPRVAEAAARREERLRIEADAARWRELAAARTRWLELLDDLQARVAGGPRLSFEAMEWLPGAVEGEAGPETPRLRLAGRLAPPADGAEAEASPRRRMEVILEALRQAPWCRAIEQERFDLGGAEAWRFEAVLSVAEGWRP